MTPYIERMAREAGLVQYARTWCSDQADGVEPEDLARFAALVRAQALEDAAKVCESQRFMALEPLRMHTAEDERRRLMASLKHVAAAIRALPPHG